MCVCERRWRGRDKVGGVKEVEGVCGVEGE